MNEKQELFTKYMDEFKKLDPINKTNELLDKLKAIFAYISVYASDNNIEYLPIKSVELTDLKDDPTIDDYIEVAMVYAQNIEELLGLILDYIKES